MEWILKELVAPLFGAVLSILVCAGLGFAVSEYYDWTHWLVLVGSIVGLALGILVARRISNHYVREEEQVAEQLRAN